MPPRSRRRRRDLVSSTSLVVELKAFHTPSGSGPPTPVDPHVLLSSSETQRLHQMIDVGGDACFLEPFCNC